MVLSSRGVVCTLKGDTKASRIVWNLAGAVVLVSDAGSSQGGLAQGWAGGPLPTPPSFPVPPYLFHCRAHSHWPEGRKIPWHLGPGVHCVHRGELWRLVLGWANWVRSEGSGDRNDWTHSPSTGSGFFSVQAADLLCEWGGWGQLAQGQGWKDQGA